MGSIIPTAEASVKTLIESIDKVIINPIIFLLFACAMVYFLYGLAQYLLSPDNEEVRKTSKSHMLWGIIGLFIMVSVFGVMKIILNTLGTKKVQINNTGDFQVNQNRNEGDIKNLEDEEVSQPLPGPEILTNEIDFGAPKKPSLPAGSSYTKSPYTKVYEPSPLCWRNATDIYAKGATEYKAIESVKELARTRFLTDNGLLLSSNKISMMYPIAYETKTLYDLDNKTYYVWLDARAPINGGKDTDCNLKEIEEIRELLPTERSKKPNPLTFSYVSDAKYYRVMDSGVDKTQIVARQKAIYNALIQIGQAKGKPIIMKGDNPDPIVDFYYRVLPEEKYYDAESLIGNNGYDGFSTGGNYDYWVVVEAER